MYLPRCQNLSVLHRSVSHVFDPSQTVVSDAGLLLGIRNKNVTYASNSDGKIVVFEQDGDLWSYAPSSGKITRIFSFRKDENNDSRYVRTEHPRVRQWRCGFCTLWLYEPWCS